MSAETHPRERRSGWFLILLVPVVPALVGYLVFHQARTPALDFMLDWQTGAILEVASRSPADHAGFMAGDVIHTVDGIPLAEWYPAEAGTYQVALERDGRPLTLELPVFPMAKANLSPMVSGTAVALTYWSTSLLLLLRRFQQKEAWLVFASAQTLAITLLFPMAYPSPWFIPTWALHLSVACLYLSAPLILHHYLTFPVMLGTRRQRRWGLGLLYALALLSVAGWLSRTLPGRQLGILYTILVIAVAIGVLIYVYVYRATPDGRRRLRLVVLSTAMAGIPSLLLFLVPTIVGYPHRIPLWLAGLFTVVAPLGYMVAILRHNLFGIDRLLNRTLVYAILSLGILLLYLGPFLLIYRFLPGDTLARMMVAAGLTLLVGLGFDWSRTQVQRLVDRLFYGGWYDYPGVVEAISDALARSLDREQLGDVLTRRVPQMMQLHRGELWIGEPDAARPAVRDVRDALNPLIRQRSVPPLQLQFPLSFRGQVRGLWAVGPRRDGDDFSGADRRILQTLARQAEITLRNVLLVETLRRQLDEIRTIQRQLLRSREEERARLARDLHDGPIQVLVGLNLQLGLLLALLREEGSPRVEALQNMRVEVRGLLSELRQVGAELRPPMLDTLGLGAALRALAEDWSAQAHVAVSLDLSPDATLRSLPGEVSVNLYRVAQEALTNVARHAAARQVTIRLAWENTCLVLSVRDDGDGFVVPAASHSLAAQGHFGMVGMQERVAIIGGTWTVESSPGQGTTIRVAWPIDDLKQA